MSDVAVVRCDTYDRAAVSEAVRRAVESAGGLDVIREGMTVAVKVNLVAAAAPERAVTTHPAVVGAVCELIRERGARAVIGDSPGGLYTPSYVGHIYRASGMEDLVSDGVTLNDDFSEDTATFPDAKEAKSFLYTAYLKKADLIIDVCKLKTHGMMGMSAAAKNMFGAIPGTVKPEYHFRFPTYERFADMILDLDEYFAPAMCICDAVEGMEGNGPTAGTPRPLGCILASKNPHALDLVGAKLIGLTPTNVPTLAAAIRRGLIPDSIDQLKVDGDIESLCVKDWNNIATLHSLAFKGASRNVLGNLFGTAVGVLLSSKPKLHKKECVGCNLCGKMCPAGAIKIIKGKATVDRKKCIRCFCCQEFCPKGAMKVHRPLAAKILDRSKKRRTNETDHSIQ